MDKSTQVKNALPMRGNCTKRNTDGNIITYSTNQHKWKMYCQWEGTVQKRNTDGNIITYDTYSTNQHKWKIQKSWWIYYGIWHI